MSSTIDRPIFFENQILGAADLTATVEHSRGQQARHNRYLHLWGISYGLGLTAEGDEQGGVKFKKITVAAGAAIDGTGREILVPQPEALSENKFSQLQLTGGLVLADVWFPIFLVGKDQPAQQPPLSTKTCDGSAPSRVEEKYDITFGRPGGARRLDEQEIAKVGDGPGSGGWQILLGFVQWNDVINKFIDFKYSDGGISRRYAGVQADVVAARGGALEFRTQTTPQAKKPALLLDETGDGLLQFGSLDAQGNLQPVFSVDAKGDVKAKGKIAGAVTPGSVQVQSGIVMDGLLLPLPPGIDPADLDSGKFTLHSHVTPYITAAQAPTTTQPWGAVPLDCFVDSSRRVTCKLRWFRIDAINTFQDRAALCEYTAIVSVPAT